MFKFRSVLQFFLSVYAVLRARSPNKLRSSSTHCARPVAEIFFAYRYWILHTRVALVHWFHGWRVFAASSMTQASGCCVQTTRPVPNNGRHSAYLRCLPARCKSVARTTRSDCARRRAHHPDGARAVVRLAGDCACCGAVSVPILFRFHAFALFVGVCEFA